MGTVIQSLSERILISHRPKIYVHDTPGVFPRTNLSKIAQLRLASANLFPIKQIPYNYLQVADYMLFSLNHRENWRPYMAYSGLSLPTDNIHVLLNGEFFLTHQGFYMESARRQRSVYKVQGSEIFLVKGSVVKMFFPSY